MTTRIYRASPGRWVAVTRHPSGGVVRETYSSGRAALIALDGRNRERRETSTAFLLHIGMDRAESFGDALEKLDLPSRRTRDDRTGLEESIKAIAGWGVSTSEFLDNVRATFYRPAMWSKRDTGVTR